MGRHIESSPPRSSRSGMILCLTVAAFVIGLVAGFISGLRSERMEHERSAQRSKFALEQSDENLRKLQTKITSLESQLNAARDESEKWRAMKTVDSALNSGK